MKKFLGIDSLSKTEQMEKLQVKDQILLSLDMIHIESGLRDVTKLKALIDEQNVVSRNKDGILIGHTTSIWNRGQTKIPAILYFDLGCEYNLESIAFYDGQGTSDILFSIGEPGNWQVLSRTKDAYHSWNEKKVVQSTRYIRLETPSAGGAIHEIAFFGTPTGEIGNEFQTDFPPIPLRKDQIINLTGIYSAGTASTLIDEQPESEISGFPSFIPNTHFGLIDGAGWPSFPYEAVIDLKQNYHMKYLTFYQGVKKGSIKIFYGEEKNWTLLIDDEVSAINGWLQINMEHISTRYIKIQKAAIVDLYEIVLYGDPVEGGEIPEPPKPIPTKVPTMDKFIGMNGMYPTPLSVLNAAGSFREYHNAHYNADEKDDYKVTFSTKYQFFDELYKTYHKQGIDIIACLQAGIDKYWGKGSADYIPAPKGADLTLPESYMDHAVYLFNFVARYGSVLVDHSRLALSKYETNIQTGLNLIHFYENWNEPNSTWKNKNQYFLAGEFAAMTSADYDGHEGRLGNNVGVKNADPKAVFVMGGLVGINLDYIKGMNYWFQQNRSDRKFAADVVNVHEYVGQKSPENSDFKRDMTELVDYVQREIPGREVWLTEFGYDSYNGEFGRSKTSAPTLKAQSDWMIRTYLIASRIGVNRLFMFQDVDPGADNNQWAAGVYATSGLVRHGNFDYERKPSYYSIYTTKMVLKDMVFDSIILEEDRIYIYKYRSLANDRFVYALWSPTEGGEIIPDYRFVVGGNSHVSQTMITNQSTNGETTELPVTNGYVTVTVSETPLFLQVSPKAEISTPTANLVPKAYAQKVTIELYSKTPNTKIYYTTDGSEPGIHSTLYVGEIGIIGSVILKAVAVKGDQYSRIAEFPYQIDLTSLSVENTRVSYMRNVLVSEERLLRDIGAIALKTAWTLKADLSLVDCRQAGHYKVKVFAVKYNNIGEISNQSSAIDITVIVTESAIEDILIVKKTTLVLNEGSSLTEDQFLEYIDGKTIQVGWVIKTDFQAIPFDKVGIYGVHVQAVPNEENRENSNIRQIEVEVYIQSDIRVEINSIHSKDSKKFVKDVRCQLFYHDGTKVNDEIYSSDASGTLRVKHLAIGMYFLKVIKVPREYELPKENPTFEVKELQAFPTQLTVLIPPNSGPIQLNQILLTPDMIHFESGVRDAQRWSTLIDEQNILTVNSNGKLEGKAIHKWNKGNTKVPTVLYFDLKMEYDLESIAFFDGEGTSNIRFSIGYPGKWEVLPKPTDGYNIWNELSINKKTRYVRVESPADSGGIYELVIFGNSTGNLGIPIEEESLMIALDSEMILEEFSVNSENSATSLIDEQPKGNRSDFPDYIPKTQFALKSGAGYPKDPYEVIFDLKEEYNMHYLLYYLGFKKGSIKIYHGDKSHWTELVNDEAYDINGWMQIDMAGISTRYIRILKASTVDLYEVVLYGRIGSIS